MADYHVFRTPAEVDGLIAASHDAPLVLFKHSTRCSISTLAKARLDRALAEDELALPVHYLDLIAHRDASDYVAEALGVRHESPQVIIVDKGEARYVATHLDIDPYALRPEAAA